MSEIRVIDSIMGSGKSTWAIQHMLKKQKEGERFIYVTPYLDEVERVKEECGFSEPEEGKKGKLASFKELIANNKNICTTHSLFKLIDDECLELLSVGYTLILDEVLDVVQETTIKKGDIDNMMDLNIIKYNEDGDIIIGDIDVVREKSIEPNEYQTIAKNLLRHSLEIVNGKKKVALIWLFPVDLINIFDEVYILTFMFDGYPMKGYLDLHNIPQKKYSTYCIDPNEEYENRIYKLVDYAFPDMKEIKPLLDIAQKGKINDIGEKDTTFTYSWWDRLLKDKTHLDWITLRKNINNFLVNYCSTTSKKKVLWSTFIGVRSSLYSKTLTDDNFIPINIRATNQYKDKDVIVYLVDKWYNPVIKNWFKKRNIKVDENSYALGEMLQNIWRSAIREGNPVKIYIPSKRMRELLLKFVEGRFR